MKKNLFHHLRLGLFPVVLGLTSVLMGGTINRVMIVELGISTTLVGLFFALPLLISPLRIWLGYRTDAYPLWGLRREPFIILGDLVSSLCTVGVMWAMLNMNESNRLVLLAAGFIFIVYGIGRGLSSNTFEALQADKFKGDQRPRAVAFLKVAMFLGIIGGSVLLARFLDPFSFQRLLAIVFGVAITSFVVTVISILRQEPRTSSSQSESQEARNIPFWQTFTTYVWGDSQVRLFFIFVMLTVVGTLAQDVILEPYAALVFNMSVGETTSLTAIWGAGTLVAMLSAGGWLIKRLGYERVLRYGLWLGVGIFIGLIISGIMVSKTAFLALVFFLGISTGFSAAAMLTAVIEFTTPARAGLLMGVWGLAHNFGQAFGSLFSGAVVDIVRAFEGNVLTAYGAVFAIEALLLLVALGLLSRIKMTQARILVESQRQGVRS